VSVDKGHHSLALPNFLWKVGFALPTIVLVGSPYDSVVFENRKRFCRGKLKIILHHGFLLFAFNLKLGFI
jgi:hypothetical protein